MSVAKIHLGRILATPAFIEAIERPANAADEALHFLGRHVTGDWGDVDDEDRATNDHAAILGQRIISVYYLADGTKFWIITEADRSVTTFLLPADY